MEAKDTVMILIDPTPTVEKFIKEQAEISFKAGEQEADKKWRQILEDSVVLAKLAGRREVVEWVNNNVLVQRGLAWQAKLKEWGIDQV